MIAVMDIPCYYGLNDEKLDSHLVFSDDLISQFRADGAVVGQWTEVFNTSSLGPIDGAPGCVNAVSNYLDDALYYVYPNFRPAISEQELDDQSRLWIEAFNLMGVKIVPELYQGVNVPLYSEPTKTELSRIGDFYTAPSFSYSPISTAHIITAATHNDDFRVACNPASFGSPNQTELFFNVYPNAFRDKNKLTLSGITADVAYVWIIIGGYSVVGDIKLYTSASVRVILNTLDGDTVLHKDSIDGKEFNTLDIIDDDPYQDDPNEGGDKPGAKDPGGKGDHDNTSDVIDIPDLPLNDVLNTGMVALYSPTAGQVRALASAIFSQSILDQLKYIMSNPMDFIISLHFVPIIPSLGGSQVITLGNVSTGVSAAIVTAQYVECSFGSVTIGEYWGAFSDYSDTEVSIYLPYIGFRSLNIQDIMGATVTLVYHVDVLTGALQAMVKCVKSGKAGSLSSVEYTFSGNFVSSIPFQGSHYANVLGALIGVGEVIGGAAAIVGSNGAAAPVVAGKMESGAMAALNGMKQQVERSGSTQTTPGSLGVQEAYIVVQRPIQVTPDNFGKLTGYGSMVGRSLGSFNGLTVVTDARINISKATDGEKKEILSMLKQGVVV